MKTIRSSRMLQKKKKMVHTRASYGAGFSLTTCRTLLSYAVRSFLNKLYASAWAGDSGLGSSRRSWTPRRICLIVIAGFHASSSFRIDKQTVPEGYTLG